jgi:nitrate reductase NapE component
LKISDPARPAVGRTIEAGILVKRAERSAQMENMEKHAQLIGILWIVYGVFSLLGGAVVLVALLGVSFIPEMGDVAPQVLRIVGLSVGAFIFVLAIPKIIGGLGLLKRREWARILLLILSFLSLLNIPLGTALGIYSLVYLMKPEMINLFKLKT